MGRRLLVLLVIIAAPTFLFAPAFSPQRALLPADLLVQFEPWRSHLSEDERLDLLIEAHWDPLVWDGIAQFYPWRRFAAESLRGGVIPLWNPYQFCGTPFLANGQSAVLYPLNLLFWLLPVYYAFAWSAWLHLSLTGWFTYRFLRRIGLARIPALCGCVVWQLNSFTIAWIHLPTVLCTIAWLPAILLMCERALLTGRARFALAAGLALGLSCLGGHPQMFLYVGLMTATYTLARGLSRAVGIPFGLRLLRLVWVGAVTGALGLALSSAQLLPTLDFLRVAHRAVTIGPGSYQAYLGRAFQPVQLAGLLTPHPLGHPGLGAYLGPENYADYCLYVGVAALFLALAAVLTSRIWHARFFGLAALASLLIALGTALNWPLYHWIPGMASAGGPSRFAILVVFSLSVLVGVGADRLAELPLRRPALLVLVVFAVLAAALGIWARVVFRLLGSSTLEAFRLTSWDGMASVVSLVLLLFCLSLVRLRHLRVIGQTLLLVVLAADLLLAARGHLHIVPREWVYPEAANPGPVEGRVIGNASDWPLRGEFPEAVLPPNAATVYHIRDVGGYDSLYLARYRDFASLMQGADPSPPANGNMILFRLGEDWLRKESKWQISWRGRKVEWGTFGNYFSRVANAAVFFSPFPFQQEPYHWHGVTMQAEQPYFSYLDFHVAPRAWTEWSAWFEPTRTEAFGELVSNAAVSLVITGDPIRYDYLPRDPCEAKRVVDVSCNAVEVNLWQDRSGYLFLADSYAPGWHADADGKALRVMPADVAFRAVAVPQHATKVVFRYEPASFRVGLFVSLLAAAFVIGSGIGLWTRRHAKG